MRSPLALCGVLVLICLGPVLGTPVASAAPAGSIDRDFGSAGVAVAQAPAVAADAVVLGSGQMLVLGEGADGRRLVVRGFMPGGAVLPGVDSTIALAGAGQTGQGVDSAALDGMSGRVIVLASFIANSNYESELLAVDSDGQLDASFGDDGRLALPGHPDLGGIAIAPDGTILVAAIVEAAGGGQDVAYDRVSPDGALVSQASAISSPGDAPVPVALPDGSALVAINGDEDNGGSELMRFDSAGEPDPTFGRGGVVRLGHEIEIDAATTDGPGGVLLAGAHLRSYSRSGFTPASPLLMRVSTQGQVDRGFGPVGRGIGGGFEFSAVAVDGDRIFAATPTGAVASLSASTGDPDPSFGAGGLSPAPGSRFGAGGPFTLDGSLALVAGAVQGEAAARGLTLAGVHLTGAGVLPPRAGRRVTVRRVAGTVGITVPLSAVEQPLTEPIAAPLPPGIVDQGESGIYIPPATILDTRRGTAAIDGSTGSAVIHGGVVSVRRRQGAVATIIADRRSCAATTLRLRGGFAIGIGSGGPRFVVLTPRSRLRVRPCNSPHPLAVLAGRVRATGHGPRVPG